MTNKEQAQIHFSVMTDPNWALKARQDAMADLLSVKKTSKAGWDKLGINKQDFEAAQQAIIDTETIDLKAMDFEQTNQPTPISADVEYYGQEVVPNMPIEPAKPKTTKPSGDQRGLISAKIRCLLMDTDAAYKWIVETVKAEFPEANTTTRSVASVAAQLRQDGVTVSFRRPTKGAA